MTTWILVADAGRGRLFTTELRENDWKLVENFEHKAGRQRSQEIEDRSPPGRMAQGESAGGRHTAFEPRTSPKEVETEHFVQQLVDYLEDAIGRRQYDQLVLVAPPHFLGALKKHLHSQATKAVHASIDKDLCLLTAAEIRAQIIDEVFPQPAA